MTFLRKFGALIVVLAYILGPTLACTASDMPMTSAERACCQMMKDQCGQTEMPASHSCCHKFPGSFYDTALQTNTVALHQAAVPVVWLPAHQLAIPASSRYGWTVHREFRPLKSPSSAFSILRI